MPTDLSRLRNFCIIAHITHGRSPWPTACSTSPTAKEYGNMRAQYLDKMDLERERGITIKAQAVRLAYAAADGREYILNLIDTPGHVDFTYEASRPGRLRGRAVLLVDAAQGIEAQDPGQPLPGRRGRPGHHPGDQQDRPAGRPARPGRPRDRAGPRGAGRRDAAGLGQDRRGRARPAGGPGPAGRRRPATRTPRRGRWSTRSTTPTGA